MKKSYWFEIIFAVCCCVLLFIGGWFGGMSLGDARARESVLNSEATDLFELAVKNDHNVEIIISYYDYKNGTGYLVLEDENIYTINVKVKKNAPFRYEWVEDAA